MIFFGIPLIALAQNLCFCRISIRLTTRAWLKTGAGLQIYQFSYLSPEIIFTRMASPFSLSCLLAEMALCWYCVRLLIHMPTLSAPWEGKGAAFFSQEILSAIWSDLILWTTCNADRKGENLLQVLFFTELRKSFLLDPWDTRVKR